MTDSMQRSGWISAGQTFFEGGARLEADIISLVELIVSGWSLVT